MSTPVPMLQNPTQASTQLEKQKMELAQHEVKSLGQSKLTEAEKAKKLRDTCESFESIFIQKMWQQMRATLPQENPLVGREEKFWQSMYDQEFSKEMAKGGGIGLADMMYEQLSENLFNVSKTTANAYNAKGFEVTMPPMLPASSSVLAAKEGALGEQDTASKNGVIAQGQQEQKQKFAGLYENIQPQSTINTAATPGAPNTINPVAPDQNTASVQQFLLGLQAKQGLQGALPTAQSNGLQLAQQAQLTAATATPSGTVLPQVPQVVRYTTNIPKNARQNDAESQMKDLLARAAAQQTQQHMVQPWVQASPQQQAHNAVQDALRVAQQQASPAWNGQNTVPPTPAAAPVSPTTVPYTPITPMALTAPASPVVAPVNNPAVRAEQVNSPSIGQASLSPYAVPPVAAGQQKNS